MSKHTEDEVYCAALTAALRLLTQAPIMYQLLKRWEVHDQASKLAQETRRVMAIIEGDTNG